MNAQLRVEIKKVRTHNSTTGYTVADVAYLSYEGEEARTNQPVIVGTFPSIFPGDEFNLEARWIDHDIYGPQLRVIRSERCLPRTKKGIAAFIQRHAEGVGKVLSNRIVDEIGINVLSVIEEDWKPLAAVKGVSEKRAMKIQESLFAHSQFEPVSMFMLNHGASYQMALDVYEEFGHLAIQKVRDNPYLLGDAETGGYAIADSFAEKLGNDPTAIMRFRKAVIAFLHDRASRQGDLYVNQEEMLAELPGYMLRHGAFKHQLTVEDVREHAEKALKELTGARDILIVTEEESELVYLPYYFHMENQVVTRVHDIMTEDRLPLVHSIDIEEWIERHEQQQGFRFAERQKEALYVSLEGGMSILTGGPGTGKTQTINAIIQCLKTYNHQAEIMLMAPTGKASKRMTELTGIEAKTIHRSIGLRVGGMTDDTFIDADLVIVDEVSMMDIHVCYRLLLAMQEGVNVLFVGDVDQLPSVGPGLVLRDFIRSGVIPTVVLNEIFRQAKNSQIILNAHAAIKGLDSKAEDGVSWTHDKEDFFFLERVGVDEAKQTLISSVRRFMKRGYRLEDVQVLTPVNGGPLGVWSLNQLMQKEFNPGRPGNKEIRLDDNVTCFREGDRVLHTENNQELDVFNGEVGVIDHIGFDLDRGQVVTVLYESDDKGDEPREVLYAIEDLKQLQLAYATTIHKSQGSEYPVVINVCHQSATSMLNRNLLYTSWTRAREIVVNIGQVEEMDAGIARVEQMNRNSKITEKLQEKFK